jgi:hypothetical protein
MNSNKDLREGNALRSDLTVTKYICRTREGKALLYVSRTFLRIRHHQMIYIVTPFEGY